MIDRSGTRWREWLGRLRRQVGTVRFRVTALATLVVLSLLIASGITLVVVQRRVLLANLDDNLRRQADSLAAVATAGEVPADLAGRLDAEDSALQIVNAEGRVVAASRNIAGLGPIADASAAGPDETFGVIEDLPVDDEPFRLLSRRVDGPNGTVVLHVAGNLDDVDDSADVLADLMRWMVPLVTALLALLIWRLVGRTLRPVEAIRAQVAEIGGSDLHRRVPQPGTDDEIDELARTMNAMLDRVEEASARQQRFVADASHELRSPLTRIRSELEVDLAHPDHGDPVATHRSVLNETTGLQQLVADLLYLARSDGRAVVARRDPVDLDDIVLRQARHLRNQAKANVDTTGVAAAQVLGHAEQLARAVGNVSDNALRYAGSTVRFTLDERDGQAMLAIDDDGPGIPPEQDERIFDRFTRLDAARDTTTGGTGLGLAIARDIIGRHGGTIAVDQAHRPGARFVITLPLAPPNGAPR